MFTTWQNIEDWITENQFDHWFFTRNRISDGDKVEKLVDSDYYTGDFADKLAMTKKYLEINGGTCYGYGYKKVSGAKGAITCDVRLDQYPAPAACVGSVMQAEQQQSIGEIKNELRKSITAELEAKMQKERYEDERKAFEKEKAAFRREQESVIGLFVHKVAPFAIAALNKGTLGNTLRHTAGLDTDEPTSADPVQPLHATQPAEAPAEAEQPENDEQSPFTDEEADELFSLMERFKKVEPDYLQMIRKVVEMAESQSVEYQMASKFLKG